MRHRIASLVLCLSLGASLPTAVARAVEEEDLRDEEGRIVRALDADGQPASYEYDEDGELVATQRSDGSVIVHEPHPPPDSEAGSE